MEIGSVKDIAVIGAGVMGYGIAMTCARAGYKVRLYDNNSGALDNAKKLIESGPFGVRKQVEKGKLTQEEMNSILGNINYDASLQSAAKEANIVIEAVVEIADVKKKVFKDLESIVSKDTIMASNTSTIMVTELASVLSSPERFMGMHWFSPAQIMKLIELVKGTLTSESTYKLLEDFSIKLGKVPIRANDGPGFFTTRFISAYINEAFNLFDEGIADIAAIDRMCKLAFGFAMGPFQVSDLTGLDTNLHCLDYLYDLTGDTKYKASLTLRKLVMAGYVGQKLGSRGGWYTYYNVKVTE